MKPQRPGGRPRSSANARVSPARRAAFHILLELRRNPASHSDRLLRSAFVNALAPADRNLTTALVMGVLRWGLELDRRILELRGGGHRDGDSLDDVVEVALELGALQLWQFDRIPAHAAIFESVELVKLAGFSSAAGLVNAILRELQRKSESSEQADLPEPATAAQIARRWAHPLWLVERWSRAYGPATAAAICRYHQSLPVTAIRISGEAGEAALTGEEITLGPGTLVKQARVVLAGDVSKIQALRTGQARIQDEGSQLVGELAAGLGRGGAAILDCCAAPGGKLAILAERNPGARIRAIEIHPGRLSAMRRLLGEEPSGVRIDYRQWDAEDLDARERFDLILLDAPCSGTGTLARNPEIRYRLELEDLARHRQKQARLLGAAMHALNVGGRLVYSTCSLEGEENEAVIESFLREQRDFRLEPAIIMVRALEAGGKLQPGVTEKLFPAGASGDFLRTLPGLVSCDGFFAAVLTRES